MVDSIKTPGVYINEMNAFPQSVVEVATAVPAFLGYTEKAGRGIGIPQRIGSMDAFVAEFGGPPPMLFEGDADRLAIVGQRYYLYHVLKLYFENGGGDCWIVPVGGYAQTAGGSADFTDDIWAALAAEPEPTIYVVPDAVALAHEDYVTICNRMMQDCATLQDRVAILDIYGGDGPDLEAAINGAQGFRQALRFSGAPSFAAAYAPWLNTIVTGRSEIGPHMLSPESRATLATAIRAEGAAPEEAIAQLAAKEIAPDQIKSLDSALQIESKVYAATMDLLLQQINVLPPSGAIAGIWVRIDADIGVWQAPANESILGVISPVTEISESDQQDMNVPLDGLAVNAIRSFGGRGVLVWGARTLDGNSQDWRYINVRRTLVMIEQSVKLAVQSFAFASNDSQTWQSVQGMIEAFLTNLWKQGALAGATPQEAFDVAVGLGSTMTAEDILNGLMAVTIKVAVQHPAEFIVISIRQQMQAS